MCKAVEELVEKRVIEVEVKAKKATTETVIAMLNDGIDVNKVAGYTKLPLEVVKELQKSL